jgi:hypothetical protein
MVANVSDRDISIDARLVNWDATTLAYLLPYTFPPGQGRGVAMPFEETSYVRCEFKFTGFANEVRGTLNVTSAGGTPTVVIDAR